MTTRAVPTVHTRESAALGLLEPVLLHAAARQAHQLGPDGQHGLTEGQVVDTEGDDWQLGSTETPGQLRLLCLGIAPIVTTFDIVREDSGRRAVEEAEVPRVPRRGYIRVGAG